MSISCPRGASSGVSQPDESSASLSVEALGFSSLYAFNCTVCVSSPPAEDAGAAAVAARGARISTLMLGGVARTSTLSTTSRTCLIPPWPMPLPNSLCEESGVGRVGACGSSTSVCSGITGTLPPTVRRPAEAGLGPTLARFEPRVCVCVLTAVPSAADAGASPARVSSVVTMGVTSVC